MQGAFTIHIVDDDLMLRQSLSMLLAAEGFRTCEHGSVTEYLNGAHLHQKGCVITDLQMGLGNSSGFDLLGKVKEIRRVNPVLVISGDSRIATAVKAFKHGAFDFLLKPFSSEHLFSAVYSALNFVEHSSLLTEELRLYRQRLATLLPHEMDILTLRLRGDLNAKIAAALGISEQLVNSTHIAIMAKTQAKTLHGLARMYCLAEG